jgi:hypothetical protein
MNLRNVVALGFAAAVAFGMAAAATPVLGGPSGAAAPVAPKTATTATTVVKTAPTALTASNTAAEHAWVIVSPPGVPSRPMPTWVQPTRPRPAAQHRDVRPVRSHRRHHPTTHRARRPTAPMNDKRPQSGQIPKS